MASRRHTPEQALAKLGETDAAIAGRSTGAEAARRIGVSAHTFYPWRSESGGPMIDQAGRLQRSVADLTLNNRILKEAPGGGFGAFHVVAAVSTAPATLL